MKFIGQWLAGEKIEYYGRETVLITDPDEDGLALAYCLEATPATTYPAAVMVVQLEGEQLATLRATKERAYREWVSGRSQMSRIVPD